MNFADLIKIRGTEPKTCDRTFIMYRDEEDNIKNISYSEFYTQCLIYGNMLKELKLQKNTDKERFHVGAYMQNVPEFLYLLGGCAFSGSVLVGINNAQIGEKLANDIKRMDVDVLFVDSALHKTNRTFIKEVIEAREKYGFDRINLSDIILLQKAEVPEGISSINKKLEESIKSLKFFKPWELDENATGIIIFTSGTTGVPKGIEVPWKKLIDVAITSTKLLNYTEKDVGYVCMPLNHSNSLYLNVMPAIWNCAKIGLRRKFSVSKFVKDLIDYKATVWNCVGDPVQYILNVIGEQDYSYLPLRIVISTGTPPDNREKFSKIFGLEEFKEVYGSTEVGAITAVTPDSPKYTVGKLLRDIKIVSETSEKECEFAIIENGRIKNFENAVGEIVVNQHSLGSSKFVGYYKMPEESEKSVDANNYFHMGDIGAITLASDGTKYLIFLGRTGDWIRSKGENWSPVDIENIILKYSGVNLSAIIGVPQAEGREDDPLYVIETTEPKKFDPQDFYEWCINELPHYTLPRFIRVLKSIPKTDTIKIQKSLLKREFFIRTPDLDNDINDMLFVVISGKVKRFTSKEYIEELAKYKDPVAKDRLVIFTKNPEVFERVRK